MTEKDKLTLLKNGTSSRILKNIEMKQAYCIINELADLNGTTFDNIIDALYSNIIRERISHHIEFIKDLQRKDKE